jgi:multidrug efflux pump subunit AcrA (membrane-fusion protein)
VRDGEAPALLGGAGSSALRAPIAGVVVLLSAQLGEVREPGSGPLVELADKADVQIEVRLAHLLPEHARFSFLGAGQPVQLELEALSPRVSARDGTSLAWFHVAPGETAPAPGSTGIMRVDPAEGAVAIPLRALEEGPEGSFVTVSTGGSQLKTPVRVLVRGSAEALVSGIAEGVEVLVAQAERG